MYLAEIDWITLVQWYSPFQHFQLSLRLVFFYSNQNFPARRFLRESAGGGGRFIFQGIVLDFHIIYQYCAVALPKLRLVFARIVIRIFARLLWKQCNEIMFFVCSRQRILVKSIFFLKYQCGLLVLWTMKRQDTEN